MLKHYAFIDQLSIISLHIKTESEDQEKNEFTAMRNKFMQRPAFQVLPCRCTYNQEKPVVHGRIEYLEENINECKVRMNGFQLNMKSALPSKLITGGDNDAPEEIDEGEFS